MARALIGGVLPALVLLVWEVLGQLGRLPSENLARPSLVMGAWADALASGELMRRTGETLLAAAGGWALGALLAVPLGVLLGLFPSLAKITSLSIEAMRPIPSVALIPLGILLFGLTVNMEMAIVAFATFWPILVVTASAVRGVEPRLLEVGRALRLPLARRITTLVVPAVLPGIAVGLRVAVGIALVVAVTVEIATNPRGLGDGMIKAAQGLRPELMFAYLLWLGAVGWALNLLLGRLERRWLGWFWDARQAGR